MKPSTPPRCSLCEPGQNQGVRSYGPKKWGHARGAWFVPVEWIHTVASRDAVREVGFFGNQNTVAKPKSEKWEHTIETLKKKFGVS